VTLDEFLAALEKTPRDWIICEDGAIRRFVNMKWQECPITSIKQRPCSEWRTIGEALGLRLLVVDAIASAADSYEHSTLGLHELRQRILKACGLPASESGGEA
jgi:hypothetical protein